MSKAATTADRCAVCGKPVLPAYRPFCSKRCADVDLQRWFAGAYAVPGETREAEDHAPENDPES